MSSTQKMENLTGDHPAQYLLRCSSLRVESARCLVRQLGKPSLLAATYKGDAAGIAAAAMEEVESTLVNCLHELERLSLLPGGPL